MHKPVLGSMVLVVLLVSSALLIGHAYAAERARPIRIGALTEAWGPVPSIIGLRDGLLALEYREPEQFVLGVRFTQGDLAALPAAAIALVQYKVDLIFAARIPAAKAAQMATTRIPIVFAGFGGHPVEMGLIESFDRPGGNITGVSALDVDLGPKRLEVFRDLVRLLPTSLRESRFSMAYSSPYERNPMTWRST